MAVALETVAHTLQKSPEQVWRESLWAYISQEKRLAYLDMADIQDRYRVSTPQELAARIEMGEIYSHPAWEDLIEWENLLDYVQRLEGILASAS